jgi:hypothetical protein
VFNVDVEDPFEQPGPTQARRRALRVIACGRGCLLQDIEGGRFARGASTITQQVVKNVYLSQEKTLRERLVQRPCPDHLADFPGESRTP